MTETVFSPDGHWMWTGGEWVPAPPTSPIQSNTIDNPHIDIQGVDSHSVVDSEEIKLQRETLQEILLFTEWTNTFISKNYSNRKSKWQLLALLALPLLGISQLFLFAPSPPANSFLWAIILGLLGVLSLYMSIKSLKLLIIFKKENGSKRYSMASGLFGSGIFAPSRSWIHQLDSMITKYEHLTNWISRNANAEIQRRLMEIEIELTRLIKARRMSQVLTGVVVGAAATAALKSNWDGKNN